jgi:hypothetical protein
MRKLLEQAIATIGYYAAVCGEDDQDTPAKQTIRAIREELTKPEPEPVAVRYDFDGYGWTYMDPGCGSNWLERGLKHRDAQKLFK